MLCLRHSGGGSLYGTGTLSGLHTGDIGLCLWQISGTLFVSRARNSTASITNKISGADRALTCIMPYKPSL